ncbi:Tetratricopeptide repeat protein 28 [Branchiostoma belcheri]|nr:Tetratricopeptide repeat protein 28 [Branchiostoma belcheri]
MAQLSRLAQLFHKISNNLTEKDVLRSLGKTRLADEAQHLAEEQKNEGNTQITGVTDAHQVISGLASLHIKDWQRLLEERTGGTFSTAWPVSTPTLPEDEHDIKVRLETLLTELDTPAAMADKAQQADLHYQIGDLYRTVLGNIESALLYYQNMLECSKSLPVTKQAQAHNRLGLTYDMLGKQEEAIQNHERVLTICQDVVRNEANICVAYKNLASSIALLGQGSDAKANFESALVIAEEAGNKTEQMDIYFRFGDLHMKQLAEHKASKMYFTKMLKIAVDWGSRYFELLAYNRLGLLHENMGEYEEALEWQQKALKMSQESGEKTGQITAHINVGNAYRILGNIEQATSHFDTALQLAQQTEYRHGQMDVYCKMGDLQREQLHSPRTAIRYYEQHLALARQLGDRRQEARAYNGLGLAHYAMQEYEAALGWDNKDLEICQETGDKANLVITHQNIAGSYQALGKLDQARSHYQSAMTIAMETGNKQGQMDIYLSLGDLHRKQLHEPRESHKYYTDMLALAKDLGRKDKERLAYNRLGLACEDMKDNEAALEWHQKNLKMSQEDENKTEPLIAHKNIARSYQELGKLDQARSHYQSAMTIAMETGNKQEQEDITTAVGKLDQASSQSRSAMAITNKTGNEQERRKHSKKQTGRKNCHVS